MRIKSLVLLAAMAAVTRVGWADSVTVTVAFDENGNCNYQWYDTTTSTLTKSGSVAGATGQFSLGGIPFLQYAVPVPVNSPGLGGVLALTDSSSKISDYVAFDGRSPMPNPTTWNIEFASAPGSDLADVSTTAWANRTISPNVTIAENESSYTDYLPGSTQAGNATSTSGVTFDWQIYSDTALGGLTHATSTVPLPPAVWSGLLLIAGLSTWRYAKGLRAARSLV